jgi:hypothetical protein
MTREEGFEIAEKYEQIWPKSMKYFLEITGLSEVELYEKMAELRRWELMNIGLPLNSEWRDISEAGVPFVQRLIDGKE